MLVGNLIIRFVNVNMLFNCGRAVLPLESLHLVSSSPSAGRYFVSSDLLWRQLSEEHLCAQTLVCSLTISLGEILRSKRTERKGMNILECF